MAVERIDVVISERGAAATGRKIQGIGTAATGAQGSVQLLRRSLGLLGGALVLGASLRTLADFGQAMSTVSAITNATGVQFDQLKDKARDLGATTRFTATQAADGMTFLARAGFDTNEVLASITGTLQLAQAGNLGLARAADIASNVLKGMRLETDQTGRVVDVLALQANNSNTNVEQLGDALSYAAPAAAALGISVEQSAAAVGVLSDAGVQASRAGTALRTIFVKLLDPTEQAKTAIHQMGLTVSDLDVQTRGLPAVLDSLAAANVSLTQASALVGVRQAANLLILKESRRDLVRYTQENEKAAGTAKRVADTMDQNLNGALLRVKSAFEAIIISVGEEGGNNSLTNIFDRLASLMRLVANNAGILAEGLAVLAGIITLRLVQGALTLLIGSLGKLAVAFIAVATTALPVLVGAAVGGFVAIAATAVVQGKTIQEAFTDVVQNLTSAFGSLKDKVFGSSTDALAAFSDKVFALQVDVARIQQAASPSADALREIIGRVKDLRSEIQNKLLFQQFLSPGSESIKILQGQVDSLTTSLDSLQSKLAIATGAKSKPKAAPSSTAPAAKPLPPELEKFLQQLERENELLGLTNEKAAIQKTLYDAIAANNNEKLTPSMEAQVRVLAQRNFQLNNEKTAYDAIRGPQETYQQNIDAITNLLLKGKISIAEYNKALDEQELILLRTKTDALSGISRGFLEAQNSMQDFASTTSSLITGAFQNAQDAAVNFFKTGKFEADKFFQDLASQFLKLGVQQAFAGVFGSQGGGLGLGGILQGGIQSLVGGLGFANGGSFTVGSGTSVAPSNGIDNRIVAFRARDGERVTVTPPGQSSGGVAPIVNIQVTTPDIGGFKAAEGQILAKAAAAMARANRRNN